MTSQATLVYSATVVSPNHIGNLESLMEGVELNYDELPVLGASLVSDTTSATSTVVSRTIVISFFPELDTYPVTNHAASAASVEGTVDLTTLTYGGGGSLNGTTLILEADGDDSTQNVVTFTEPTNAANVIAIINAVINPNSVASEDPITHELILTSASIGPSSSFSVIGGTAVSVLGLTVETVFGTPVNPFRGTIVSSSPLDVFGGTNAQSVTINYIDAEGDPGTEVTNLNGTTPVQLQSPNKVTIVSMVPNGTPAGLITINTTEFARLAGTYGNNKAGTTPTFPPPVSSGDRAGQILANFTGTIVSTSNADAVGGSGATSVVIDYLDALGNPHTDTVTLTGQTPVVLPTALHATIVSLTPNDPNIGTLTIYTGNTTFSSGAPAATLPASFASRYPASTDQTAPFWDLYTHALANGLGSVVTAAAPVVS
jgi:hypothetical protein